MVSMAICMLKNLQFGYQVIILWCFENDIRTYFFHKIWKAYWKLYTNALGIEYLNGELVFYIVCNVW